MKNSVSESIDWGKTNGMVPAIIQDATTSTVLMHGYMTREALDKTVAEKRVTFFSRTKNRLWTKGETSGHFLEVESLHKDCDSDSLLISVKPKGPTCHEGTQSCYGPAQKGNFFFELCDIIESRKTNPTPTSYTASLFAKGMSHIAQKVGEEAVEVILAPNKDDNVKENIVNETADLLFHLFVFLNAHEVSLEDVLKELEARHERP